MSKFKLTLMDLNYLGFGKVVPSYYQLTPAQLTQYAIEKQEGVLTDRNVLAVNTGEFTGRSPKDRFIVKDNITSQRVWWNEINIPFSKDAFDRLHDQMIAYLAEKPFFVRDAAVCAAEAHRLSVRVITETAYQNLFAANLLIGVAHHAELRPEWTVIAAPGFRADPDEDQTRQHNFSVINFTRKIILIGGTGYTGEIKKGLFSVLNFLLPREGVLPMHCAANMGTDGDTAIFFGLSGTGKTTLSADPARRLIGDDEHGWDDEGIFNFEGGCYAKTVNLNPQKEPQIFAALKPGALLENVCFKPQSNEVDFDNISITENTRVSYPIGYIPGAVIPSVGPSPQHIFFLTADAFGVLPPVSKLDPEQARYYFISGYTAKVAGTEHGIHEPAATFSACFGKAFIPLNPFTYADLLTKKLEESDAAIWLINTGWVGGPYGIGERIKLAYTRSIILAALNGELSKAAYSELPVFDLMFPQACSGVPDHLLDPAQSWKKRSDYEAAAKELLRQFASNFSQYSMVNI